MKKDILASRGFYIVVFLTILMIWLGGLTRLTHSGLSITEWKPIMGALPPLSAGQWEQSFEKYQKTPEYLKVNHGMTLSEFKFIFFMEWAHRFLGRLIGHYQEGQSAGFIMSLIGAIILLAIYHFIKRKQAA